MSPVHDRAGRVNIQPIQTRYAGHRFRSRLEARWAVFFDAMRIRWEYEPQGYVITDPWETEARAYLPDFYLPELDIWAEVKGDPAGVDWPLWGTAVDAMARTGLPDSRHAYSGFGRPGSALLVLGSIPQECEWEWLHPILINYKGVNIGQMSFHPEYLDDFQSVDDYGLGVFDPSWNGFAGRPFWHLTWEPDHNGQPNLGEQAHRQTRRAYAKARGARFEHGESR